MMLSIAKTGLFCATLCSFVGCKMAAERERAVNPELALPYLEDKPAALHPHFYVALTQGKRNRALNDMRLALASLSIGEDALAAQLLDDALALIETIYADNEQAAAARSVFTKEAVKDFKGEPYERAMVYFYRGLLYLKSGDFDNARASFKAGFLQDSFAEEEQYSSDFGLLQYLQGWASRCRGNKVTEEEDFQAFTQIKEKFPLPALEHNTLFLLESGQAPFKYSEKDPKSQSFSALRYGHHGNVPVPQVSFVRSSATLAQNKAQPVELHPLEDLYFQASTRGGREVDRVLRGKAQFKDAAKTVGAIGLQAGAALASAGAIHDNRDASLAGGAIVLAALLGTAVAQAAEPAPDTRYWDNLPERIFAGTARLPDTVTSVAVIYRDRQGQAIYKDNRPVYRAGACNLVWARYPSAIPDRPRAPFSAPEDVMNEPVVLPQSEPVVDSSEKVS